MTFVECFPPKYLGSSNYFQPLFLVFVLTLKTLSGIIQKKSKNNNRDCMNNLSTIKSLADSVYNRCHLPLPIEGGRYELPCIICSTIFSVSIDEMSLLKSDQAIDKTKQLHWTKHSLPACTECAVEHERNRVRRKLKLITGG